jgi:uncharacterized membrane protein
MSNAVRTVASSEFIPVGQATRLTGRVASVDVLRGLVMVLMALDHVRDYFGYGDISPVDVERASAALFLTRWVTHICAPTFVFLAGTSIFLQLQRKTKAEISRLLITRGAWLCILECTAVHMLWTFNFRWNTQLLEVIWVIGISMMLMAGIIQLPMRAVVLLGAVLVVGHNALDKLTVASFGGYGWLWQVLHVQGFVTDDPSKLPILVAYPLIPWPGVMAVGYAFGAVLLKEAKIRDLWMLRTGLLSLLAFVVLRFSNLYGDLRSWAVQADPVRTIMSFFNVTKYPPSLLFLLVTLGLSMLLMAGIELAQAKGRLAAPMKAFSVFGRVPFFYFLLHILVAHSLALILAFAMGKNWQWFVTEPFQGGVWAGVPPGYGFSLPIVWGLWVLVVAICYPVCLWYGNLKLKSRNSLFSYL